MLNNEDNIIVEWVKFCKKTWKIKEKREKNRQGTAFKNCKANVANGSPVFFSINQATSIRYSVIILIVTKWKSRLAWFFPTSVGDAFLDNLFRIQLEQKHVLCFSPIQIHL